MSLEKVLPGFDSDVDEKESERYVLILLNDDVNSFDHVIEALVDVCGHTAEQAEQCALFAHMKGKCDIRHGDFIYLEAMRDGLSAREISSIISQ